MTRPLTPKRSLRRTVGVISAAAVGFCTLLLGSGIVFLLQSFATEEIESRLDEAHGLFRQQLDARAQAHLFLATAISRVPEYQAAILARDRIGLMRRVEPVFRSLEAEYSIDNLHFHDPAGVTILRLHQPDSFGDALAQRRPMIAAVIASRGTASGLEWGVNGLVIRGMRAVVIDGLHVGSVEVGAFITDRLLARIAPRDARLAVYARRPPIAGGISPGPAARIATSHAEAHAAGAADTVPGAVDAAGAALRRTIDGRSGFERLYPLPDFAGRPAGVVRVWVDTTDLERLGGYVTYAVPVMAWLGALLAFLLARALGRTVTRPILAIEASMQQLASGDLDAEIGFRDRTDEIGAMARALDGFRNAMALARRREEVLRHRDRLQALGDMTGRMAHELNNLLQPVRLAVEVLQGSPLSDADRRSVAVVERSTERARQLVGDILAFARGGATPQAGPPPPTPLGEAMQRATTLVRASLGPEQRLVLPDGWPDQRVRCEPMGLCQVLLNICRNGFDAMGGRGTVTITAELLSLAPDAAAAAALAEGRYLGIAVADQGSGIDPAAMPHLFEPFFTTKPPGKGTGLGLAIVYGMVREWGGDITVASAPGAGATFRILLAVAADEAAG